MMELNREQVVKALECCSKLKPCKRCPLSDYSYDADVCKHKCMTDALALIRELTEENKDLQRQFQALDVECCRLEKMEYELTEENERLKGALKAEERHNELAMECAKKALAKAKADTVQNYRECLHREFASLGAKEKFNKEFFLTKADQIAKELLEEDGNGDRD